MTDQVWTDLQSCKAYQEATGSLCTVAELSDVLGIRASRIVTFVRYGRLHVADQ